MHCTPVRSHKDYRHRRELKLVYSRCRKTPSGLLELRLWSSLYLANFLIDTDRGSSGRVASRSGGKPLQLG